MKFSVVDGKIFSNESDKAIFQLNGCTILDYTKDSIQLQSSSLIKLAPILIKFEKQLGLDTSSFQLDEAGLSFNLFFTNRNIDLKHLIDKRLRYNIECRLYTEDGSKLLFKILKISDKKQTEIDLPEPDGLDIVEIKDSIIEKVKRFKSMFCDITEEKIKKMGLSDLIAFEENLYDFLQNNI